MNKKQKQERRELIASSIKEKTHATIAIKLPLETVAKMKSDAKKNGRIFSVYVAETVERGTAL